jgi:hypothetical protein
MGHAKIEGPVNDGPAGLQRLLGTEVLPQPQRHCWKLQPGAADAPVLHLGISLWRGTVGHDRLLLICVHGDSGRTHV